MGCWNTPTPKKVLASTLQCFINTAYTKTKCECWWTPMWGVPLRLTLVLTSRLTLYSECTGRSSRADWYPLWLCPIGLKNIPWFNVQWGVKLEFPIPVHFKPHFSRKPSLHSERSGEWSWLILLSYLRPTGLENVTRFNIVGCKTWVSHSIPPLTSLSQKSTLYSECTGWVELIDTNIVQLVS